MSAQTFQDIEPKLRQRSAFSFFSQEKIRFSDTDPLGHVNNTVYSVYCETGRIEFNRAFVSPLRPKGQGMLVARTAINFLAETHYPGVVEIGTAVLSVGRTSYTLAQGLFLEGQVIATAEGVLVMIDLETRRPSPVPDEIRLALEEQRLR
jgi:acyl-CoA thioester hydrolase